MVTKLSLHTTSTENLLGLTVFHSELFANQCVVQNSRARPMLTYSFIERNIFGNEKALSGEASSTRERLGEI